MTLVTIYKLRNVIKSKTTYFSRHHNHPCRGLVHRRNRHQHLPWWHTAVRSPCFPTCRVKRGRIWPVDCWKNEERHMRDLLIHSGNVFAGWRYVNQCSTLRCYKRTRCERCIVCDMCRAENNAMWNDRLSRPSLRAIRSTRWMPCTWTLFAIVLLVPRDLRFVRYIRNEVSTVEKFIVKI